ncbi:MAG: ribosomal-protein-alanine N-acetyltransferase [Crocinitomix sp.]|jgi:ribosomal-protein-alanine N-acetyltransferase
MQLNLETERLALCLATIADLEAIHHLHSFPEVDQFNTLGIPNDLKETETVMQPLFDANVSGEKYTFIVKDKATQTFIGMVGAFPGKPKYKSAEIWYKLMPNAWGKGYATEISKEIIRFCFETLNVHRVEAGCAVENAASVRVMEKVGMQLEGRRRQTLPLVTGWSDNFEYAILDVD